MPSRYDRLGDLLSELLESGEMTSSRSVPNEEDESRNEAEECGRSCTNPPHCDCKIIQYCNVLNVPPGSGAQAVKAAYRIQLKKYHPDTIPALEHMQRTAAERTKEIVEAYKFLLDLAEKEGLP